MRQQHVATPFCSSVLGIPTVTTTYTQTSTPACVTVTQSTSSVQTVTAVTSSVVYGTTTVYPVVAVSTTSTCEISATYIPGGSPTPPARMAKRAPPSPGSPPPPPQGPPPPPPAGPTPIARPTCLSKYGGAAITSACSCLNIPTPTEAVIATVTLPAKTITTVIVQTAQTTVTSTYTTTSFTYTYSATQYYTSTFSVLPQPTSTLTPPADPSETFGVYSGLDFIGQDITSFYCYAGGPSAPTPYPECTSFADCVNACAYYNANSLGASSSTTCGAVVYNSPADGSSGSCYLKSRVLGCGSPNAMVNTGVLLPLIPNDPQ